MNALIAGQTIALPAGITFDGMWPGTKIAAFTDHDEASDCFGASFDLPANGLTTAVITAKRAAKAREFKIAA